ncbi:MAG: oligosaccharide flippase family protein [Actinomycetota bacterium]
MKAEASNKPNEPSMGFVKSLSKDTLFYSIGKIIPAVINFASISIFTRLLSPEAFGNYQLVITAVAFVSVILSSWLQQAVYRHFLEFKNKGKSTDFIATFSWLLLATTIISCTLALCFYFFIPPGYRHFVFTSTVLLVSYLLYTNLQVVLQASLKAISYSKYEILRASMFLIFGIAFIRINQSYLSLVLAMMATYLPLSLLLTYRLGIFRTLFNHALNLETAKTIWLYGLPMFFWFLGSQVLSVSDRFFIGYFRGSAEVGIYTSNYNLMSSSIGLLTTPIQLAIYTNIMNPWSLGDKERAKSAVVSTAYYYIMFTLPILLVTALYGKNIVALALGSKFREGHVILPIILLGFLANNFALFFQKNYELEKKTRLLAVFAFLAAILNIGLNLFFIKEYGYIGAAITTAAAYVFYLILISSGIGISWRFRYPWLNLAKMGFSFACIWLVFSWFKTFFSINQYLALGSSLLASYGLLIGMLVLLREPYTLTLINKARKLIPLGLNYAKLN